MSLLLLFAASGTGGTDADAAVASATGTAGSATAVIAPNAAAATAAATAQTPRVSISPTGGVASATGSATTATSTTTASAATATATATAPSAASSIAPHAGLAAITAEAFPATIITSGAVSFVGAGNLAVAAPTSVVPGAVAFVGAGTLGITGTRVRKTSISFAGQGTLAAVGQIPADTSSVSFDGQGAIGANALRVAAGNVAFAGAGTLLAAARVVRKATINFSGAGFLNATITEPNDMYTPGPCEPWDPIYGADCLTLLQTMSPTITGYALQAASEILWSLTAQRFGLCTVTLRPCRRTCGDEFWWSRRGWWEFGSYPYPTWIAGTWFNLACSACGDSCSCTDISETTLPGPVASVAEVKVDGVVLDSDAYQVHDYRKLVRVDGGQWPLCNDFTSPTTESGTWSVTAAYGEPVPVTGRIAAGELACEIASSLVGEDCALPAGVQQLTRQGVSMTFNEITQVLDNGLVGLPMSDRFIRTWNPKGLQARSVVYDLDGDNPRVITG